MVDSMKIVVTSDAHLYLKGFDKVIYKEPDADYYLDLGDNYCGMQPKADFEEWWESVKGNNDGPFYPLQQDLIIYDKRIRMIHGDRLLWQYRTPDELFGYMSDENIDILLFGHTHIRLAEVRLDDDHKLVKAIINPGSLGESREYELRQQGLGSYCVLTLSGDGDFDYQFKTINNE